MLKTLPFGFSYHFSSALEHRNVSGVNYNGN